MDGTIDHPSRPILRVETPQADGFLCLIDTGFNRYLLLERSAALRYGFRLHERIVDQIVLGDGSVRIADIARGAILWFGEPMTIDVHVVPDARRSRYSSPEHQVEGIIGTALLDGLHVFFDFQQRRVSIARP